MSKIMFKSEASREVVARLSVAMIFSIFSGCLLAGSFYTLYVVNENPTLFMSPVGIAQTVAALLAICGIALGIRLVYEAVVAVIRG